MSSKQGPHAVGMRAAANAARHRHHLATMIDHFKEVAA